MSPILCRAVFYWQGYISTCCGYERIAGGGVYAFNSSEAMIVLTGISKSMNETSISENQLWLRA